MIRDRATRRRVYAQSNSTEFVLILVVKHEGSAGILIHLVLIFDENHSVGLAYSTCFHNNMYRVEETI